MEPVSFAPTHLMITGRESSSSSTSKKKSNELNSNIIYSELKELQPMDKSHNNVNNGKTFNCYSYDFDDEQHHYSNGKNYANDGKILFNNEIIMEKVEGLIWNEMDGSATLVNQNLWQIPSLLTVQYASLVRKLDLSYNCLQTLAGIEYFNSLEELILDNNLLDDSIRFFYNPLMQILSINKNKLTDLERFLNEITLKLPGLTYLSMLGNPACPDQLSSSEHDDKDYCRYRSYVIHRMPQLKFLDSSPVRAQERTDAKNRGHYYRLIRLNSDSFVETNRNRNHLFALREEIDRRQLQQEQQQQPKITPLPYNNDNNKPKGAFGRLKHRYTGKHSEGNRFIRNHEL